MTEMNDQQRTMLRNMLLGRWAARRLKLSSSEARAYSEALAAQAAEPGQGDVFARLRKDFDGAGVRVSDEEILRTMTELMIKAGHQIPTAKRDGVDAATALLKRRLTS